MNSVLERLESHSPGFSKNDKKISDFMQDNLTEIPNLTIVNFAKKVGVSNPAISRFIRFLGYKSYSDFKVEVSKSLAEKDQNFFFEFSEDDSNIEVLKKTLGSNISSITSTAHLVSEEALNTAVDILTQSDTCGFFGLGASSIVAFDAYHKFMRTPIKTFYNQDFHIQQIFAAKMTGKNCAMIISHSGRNRDALLIAESLKKKNIAIIAITSYMASPLAKLADATLISVSDEVKYRPEAFTSIISQISLVEALFMIYNSRAKEKGISAIKEIRKVIQNSRLP